MAISAALATIGVMQEEKIMEQVQHLETCMRTHLTEVANLSGKLSQVRGIGAVIAATLEDADTRIGNKIYQLALNYGALIRPIGNTLYWLPPLNADPDVIGKLAEITLNSIKGAYEIP